MFLLACVLISFAIFGDSTGDLPQHPLARENQLLEQENAKLMNMLHEAMGGPHNRKSPSLKKEKQFLIDENARLMKELHKEIAAGTEMELIEHEDQTVMQTAEAQTDISKENEMLEKENEKLMKLIEESLSHAKADFTADEESRFLAEENQQLMAEIKARIRDIHSPLPPPPTPKNHTVLNFFTKVFAFIGAVYIVYTIFVNVTGYSKIEQLSKEMGEFERERLEV